MGLTERRGVSTSILAVCQMPSCITSCSYFIKLSNFSEFQSLIHLNVREKGQKRFFYLHSGIFWVENIKPGPQTRIYPKNRKPHFSRTFVLTVVFFESTQKSPFDCLGRFVGVGNDTKMSGKRTIPLLAVFQGMWTGGPWDLAHRLCEWRSELCGSKPYGPILGYWG